MKTLTAKIALAFLLIANVAHAADLDSQWFKAKVVVKATHFATEIDEEDTVLLDPAAMKTYKAGFWMELEAAGDEGEHIASIYTELDGGISLFAETLVIVKGDAFVDLAFALPLTKKVDGAVIKVGSVDVSFCGRIKAKSKGGELVKASMVSLGGTVSEGSVSIKKGTKALLVGGAKMKALRVAPEKVPPIL